jgi:hypothetical protein
MTRLQAASTEEKQIFASKIESKLSDINQVQLKTPEGRILRDMFDKAIQSI